MNFDPDLGILNLDAAELSALIKGLNYAMNDLAPQELKINADQENLQVLPEFEALGAEVKNPFARALKMLAAPDQAGMLCYSTGDRNISRLKLAWVHEEQNIAVLGRTGLGYYLSLQSRDQLLANLKQALAINQPLNDAIINVSLSATASLLVLALADCYRADWYKSALANSLPLGSYTLSEINDYLKSITEDFRWSLPFFAQTLPVNLSEALPLEEVEAGLIMLAELDLLKMDGDKENGEIPLYILGEELKIISDGLLNNVGKAALSILNLTEEGSLAAEAIFFARDPWHLWLAQISGKNGIIANVNQETFDNIIHILTLLPDKPLKADLQATPVKVSGTDPNMAAPPTAPPPPLPKQEEWFIGDSGEVNGPYSREELKEMIATGSLKPGSLVWTKGMSDWMEANKIDGLL